VTSEGYATRRLDILARDRARFGAGIVAELPGIVAGLGAAAAFVVTDPGVVRSGAAGRVVDLLRSAGAAVRLHDAIEPNPGTALIEQGSAALRDFASDHADVVVVALGGGSTMDSGKVIALHAGNDRDVLSLGYHDEAVAPGLRVIAIPTTAGTGAETNTYGVITDEAAGRKRYVGHASVLPVLAILDPELTVGLPPEPTAATGVDALTHSLESLLSKNPNPLAEAIALGTVRTVGEWLPRAVDDGADLEARSRMLLAAHYAGLGQQTGTGVGAVHAIGHAIGTRGRLAHGTALATVMPEVFETYLGVRDRELALVAVALDAADPRDDEAEAARAGIGAVTRLLERVRQRRTLRAQGLGPETHHTIAQDAVEDAAIENSPVLPSKAVVLRVLAAVA
jgi:alcohol dehydrogenase